MQEASPKPATTTPTAATALCMLKTILRMI
jgi:hypothetical protein